MGPSHAEQQRFIDRWDSRNLNAVTIAELCVNRREACPTGLSEYVYTAAFLKCDFGVWALSLCGSTTKYHMPASGIQPLSVRIRIILDRSKRISSIPGSTWTGGTRTWRSS